MNILPKFKVFVDAGLMSEQEAMKQTKKYRGSTDELLDILMPHKLTKSELVDEKIRAEITENEKASELELLARDDRTSDNL